MYDASMTIGRTKPQTRRWMLILGDVAALILVTLLGFYRHSELDPQSAARMLATFVPFTFAWLLIAPWLGLYDPAHSADVRRAWVPALAAVFVAPLGAVLRGVWLSASVLPVFVGVMAGVMAVVLTAWRAVFLLVARR
jgi:hypothetical protein